MVNDELKKSVGVRRLTPTYVMVVIAVLSFAMLGCGGETATAGTVRVVKSFKTDYHSTSLAWHPNGKELATGASLNAKITVWDTATGKKLRVLDKQSGGGNQLAYSPDGRYLAVARGFVGSIPEKYHVNLYDANSGDLLRSFVPPPQKYNAADVAFSPDSRYLATGGYGAISTGVVYDLQTGQALCTFEESNPDNIIESIAFNPNGRTFSVGRVSGDLEILSATDCTQVKKIKDAHAFGISALAFSSDGERLASASCCRNTDYVQIWNAHTLESLSHFNSALHGSYRSLYFSRDNKRIFVGGGEKSIEIWDAENAARLETIEGFPSVTYVAPSPDGKHFATVSGKEIKIWEFIR